MKKRRTTWQLTLAAATLLWFQPLQAQLTLPPSGDNQKASVTQYMGLASVTIHYSSPDVHGPTGEDRRGMIWGQVVPYGLTNLDFGWSTEKNKSPWRAGANENTVIEFSHDVKIEGKSLAAGRYGLHMIPEPEQWTIIFSKNSTSWGSYFYRSNEDALRVTVKPQVGAFAEWLTYEFDERRYQSCRVRLRWESIAVEFRVEVPNMDQLYLAKIREELRNEKGFFQENYLAAAQFCLERKIALDEALQWAEMAISMPYFGRKTYQSLYVKAQVLLALNKKADATAVMREAIAHPTASSAEINQYARSLQENRQFSEALEVFKINAARYPNDSPALLGLAKGYSGVGDSKNAIKYVQLARDKAKNDNEKRLADDAMNTLRDRRAIH